MNSGKLGGTRTDTEMIATLKPELVEGIIKSSSLRRISKPEDVAEAVAFSLLTGQHILPGSA
jgi:hypothetical protein